MPAPPARRRAWRATLAVLALAAFACTGERPSIVSSTTTTTTASTTTSTTVAEEAAGAPVAEALAPAIEVYATAADDVPQQQIVSGEDTSHPSIPVVFLVKSKVIDDAERLEVYLPVRPNGSTGWVDAADVEVTFVPHRIEVAIGEHRLRVYEDDQVVFDEPVGVGRQDRPTPGGIYYIKELLEPPDPSTSYGVYAYGLSGFQPVLESFNGGDPVIGIHGTNDPTSIGGDVSSGCIRLQNEAIDRLVNDIGLPLGTPVEILA